MEQNARGLNKSFTMADERIVQNAGHIVIDKWIIDALHVCHEDEECECEY